MSIGIDPLLTHCCNGKNDATQLKKKIQDKKLKNIKLERAKYTYLRYYMYFFLKWHPSFKFGSAIEVGTTTSKAKITKAISQDFDKLVYMPFSRIFF